MNILHTVEFYHPSVGGMQEVVKQLSERLVKLGHQVTVATSSLAKRTSRVLNGVSIEEFNITGNLVRGMSGEVERYQDFLRHSEFDVVTSFAAQQWATDAALPLLGQINAAKIFVPTGFSGLYDPRYTGYFESMKTWMAQYDMNVFLSDDYRDINFARENGVKNTILIPNGAGEDEFVVAGGMDIRKQLAIPRDHFLILHVGSHTGLKGHADAIRIFAAAQINNATLLIVANDLGGGCARSCTIRRALFNAWPGRKSDGKRVLITPLPRKETVAVYHEADLFLFPSNIECSPLVLFECLASKTPFLTTDVGNAAEIAGWSGGGSVLPSYAGKHGQVKADVEGAAGMLEEMFWNADRREKMAAAGNIAWHERFTWEKITREYESLYIKVTKVRSCR